METPDTTAELERFFEQEVLSAYELALEDISWQSHERIGNDTFAHYFTISGSSYALIFEDFPGEPHFIAEEGVLIASLAGEQSIDLSMQGAEPYVENMTGFFTVYKLS